MRAAGGGGGRAPMAAHAVQARRGRVGARGAALWPGGAPAGDCARGRAGAGGRAALRAVRAPRSPCELSARAGPQAGLPAPARSASRPRSSSVPTKHLTKDAMSAGAGCARGLCCCGLPASACSAPPGLACLYVLHPCAAPHACSAVQARQASTGKPPKPATRPGPARRRALWAGLLAACERVERAAAADRKSVV